MAESSYSLSQRQSGGARIFDTAARFASTRIAKRSSGGFFGWLTGGSSSQLPPLDFPLPGVSLPPPLPDFVEPARTKITALPNGLKIASEVSTVLFKLYILRFTIAPVFFQ